MTERYLEDFEVAQTFGGSGPIRIDRERIKSFAAEFDPQPFHLDEKAAGDSMFRGLAASGWHTAAITMRLLVESELKPAGGIVGAGFDDFRWPRPVRPGDELRVESEVLEVRPSKSRPDQGLIKVRTTTLNQNGEAVQIFRRQSHCAASAEMSVKRHGLFGMTQLGSQGTVRRQSASVEFDEPSILLENLLEDVLLIVDEQQRAVCCVPYAPALLIAGQQTAHDMLLKLKALKLHGMAAAFDEGIKRSRTPVREPSNPIAKPAFGPAQFYVITPALVSMIIDTGAARP